MFKKTKIKTYYFGFCTIPISTWIRTILKPQPANIQLNWVWIHIWKTTIINITRILFKKKMLVTLDSKQFNLNYYYSQSPQSWHLRNVTPFQWPRFWSRPISWAQWNAQPSNRTCFAVRKRLSRMWTTKAKEMQLWCKSNDWSTSASHWLLQWRRRRQQVRKCNDLIISFVFLL